MALKEYRKKRDLSKTPEPAGGKSTRPEKLIFVVQRHKASHLHYDFRLEMDGVLKSWAVPKGPSMDPSDKRLAMMVEDHPYDYKDFKGIIPEGNYGAGIVEIWDNGTYEPLEVPKGKSPEQELLAELKKGSLKIKLKGKKLKGEFALVRLKKAEENSWLLIKHRDDHAVEGYDSEEQTPKNSPINKALAKEAKEGKGKKKAPKKPAARASAAPAARPAARDMLAYARKAPKVRHPVKPMLATLANEPFDGDDWIFEIKWDGYRAIAETGRELRFYSRNGLSFVQAYPAISDELKSIKRSMVLDGEVVAQDENGRPDFQRLQHATTDPTAVLVYNVFDLLELDGKDLRGKPLLERKKLLREALPATDHIHYCDHVEARGKDFFRAVVEQDLEGMIAKRKNGKYLEGKRGDSWLKIKNHRSQEAVIGGWTEPRNSRKHFGALLLGVYKGDELHYVGHTGTGFDEATLKELSARMKPLEQKKSPFTGKVRTNMPATWVKPELVANIKFTEWTREGHMRHPVFLGLRVDKKPSSVVREAVPGANSKKPAAKTTVKPAGAGAKGGGEKNREENVGGHNVELTNLKKVFWPNEGYTKGDVIEYYDRIADLLLPYLKDRPQSLYRTPNGIQGKGFFQKDAGGQAPSWVSTVKVPSDSRGGEDIDYILCNNKATLLYLANLGSIEINPWTSRKRSLLKPDHLVMDLDPSKGNTFDDVVEAALGVKVVLDKLGIKGYCKTSGATGMHIYIPMGARYTYDELAPLGLKIMQVVRILLPDTTTLERSLAKRDPKKIYLDHLQNRKGQTLACAYSLRPKPGATVSTPLAWEEVVPGLDPKQFNIRTIHGRIAEKGDLFHGVLEAPKINLKKLIGELDALLKG